MEIGYVLGFQSKEKGLVEKLKKTQKSNNVSSGKKLTSGFEEFESEGWLLRHEKLGGHTIEKHVGKSDAALINRLRGSNKITGASSFLDKETAERVILKTIESNREVIVKWLKNVKEVPKLRLDFIGSEITGRGVFRRSMNVTNLYNARVILKVMPDGKYFILTAYPT